MSAFFPAQHFGYLAQKVITDPSGKQVTHMMPISVSCLGYPLIHRRTATIGLFTEGAVCQLIDCQPVFKDVHVNAGESTLARGTVAMQHLV